MDWFSADFHSLKSLMLIIGLCLLGFGWSAIFFYAARTLAKLNGSVERLHVSVAQLFVKLGGQGDDLKDLKKRVTHLERKK